MGEIELMSLVRYVDDSKEAHLIELEALEQLAEEKEMDLILVYEAKTAEDYSVYKLGNADKLRYEQQKEIRRQKKLNKANVIEQKHIKIKEATAEHDLGIKAKAIDKFIKDGCSVLISIEYRGRSYSMVGRGEDKINRLLSMVQAEYKFEKPIKISGNTVQATICKVN